MTLNKNEWIAVVVAIFVVGFFFVFGQTVVSFFTSNDTKEKMTQQSQLGVQDDLVGTGEVATVGKRVTVHYTGKFTDGKVFDTSVSRGEPFSFILGSGGVIPGWEQGIVGMKVGGKRILIIPPELGYGMNDYGTIPGGSTLIFEIELLKVE
ncbi:MAG TPA: FKBP-type peptidyl-prolyl cis-trans isomerase [Candidatus Paceibacterota bacterium]